MNVHHKDVETMNMPWPLRLNEHTLSTMPSMPVSGHVCRRSVCDSPKSIMMIVVFCFLPVVAVIGATFVVSATTPTTLSQVFVLPHECHHIVHSNQLRYFHGGHHVVYHTQQIRKDQCILLNASVRIIDVVSGTGQVCPRAVVDLVEDVGRYGQMTCYFSLLFTFVVLTPSLFLP